MKPWTESSEVNGTQFVAVTMRWAAEARSESFSYLRARQAPSSWFPNGLRVSLPTDQIVFADDTRGHARVGFGGMRFVGSEEGRLVFVRLVELFPEDQLSPARSHKMLLDPP